MANETIDRLIFALDGDLSMLKAKYAEAEAGAVKTGTAIKANLSGGFQEAAAAAATHSTALKKTMGDVDAAVRSTHGSTATATREFRALFDELSSGRTRQTPGTLAIIATRVFGISGATLAWSVALAAVPVAFVAAAISAENSLARIRSALALTANASGITLSGGASAATAIANSSGMSILGARGFVARMAGASMPGGAIVQAGQAASQYELATGSKAEETEKLIEEMFSAPSQAAKKLNDSLNLLSASQMEEIDHLERIGDYQRAGQIELDAFNQRTRDAAGSVSGFSRALDSTEKFFGNLWAGMGRMFGAGISPDEQLSNLKAQRAYMATHGTPGRGGKYGLTGIDDQIATLQAQVDATNRKTQADAAADANRKLGRDAQGLINKYDVARATTEKYSDEITLLQKQLATLKVGSAEYNETLKVENAIKTALKQHKSPEEILSYTVKAQKPLENIQPKIDQMFAKWSAESSQQIEQDLPKKILAMLAPDRARLDAITGVQGQVVSAGQTLGNLQGQVGISGDDLRRLEVMQQVTDEWAKLGLDPAAENLRELYNAQVKVNVQISDMTQKLQDMRQAASDFAGAITGPLEQFLEKGGSVKTMLGNIFKNIGDTTVKDFIIKPVNDILKNTFTSLLGVGGKPDGSATNPYYVAPSPLAGAVGGIMGGGGGFLGKLLGAFGLGGSGGGMESVVVTPQAFGGGLASGGNVDPAKFYVVGENGPEILGPGMGGKITPFNSPNMTTSDRGSTTVATHMTATIVVQGSGDKELMANMRAGAAAITQTMIEQNNRDLSRTQRPNLIAKNKRALP